MKVYHGTNVRFDKVDLLKCNPDNDFGHGFYVTSIRRHAEQRAADIALIQSDNSFILTAEDTIINISVALATDYKMNMLEAMKLIYNSETFAQLTNKKNGIYLKPWTDIYEILKEELNIKQK